ncbi:MAG: ferritin family protein [Proteocatella sp.]
MLIKDLLSKLVMEEKKAGDMYLMLSEKLDSNLAEISLTFSKEEVHHIKILKDLVDKLSSYTKDISSVQDKIEEFINADENKPKFGEDDDSLKGLTKKEFFLYALQKEKNSVYIYKTLKDFFEDDTSLEYIFSNLIKEEENHMYFIISEMHNLK